MFKHVSPGQQDWHRVSLTDRGDPPHRSSGQRLWYVLLGFSLLLVVILARAVAIESTDGDAYRVAAARPLTRRISTPGVRGRILARDGTLLARQQKVAAIAVQYRYLEQPPNQRWLQQKIAARLSAGERKNSLLHEQARNAVLKERADLHDALAERAGLSKGQWQRRVARIQSRVERIAGSVNRKRAERKRAERRARHEALPLELPPGNESMLAWLRRTIVDAVVFDADSLARSADAARPIVVAEQLDYHVVAEGLAREDVDQIESSPERYPGVRIEQRSWRVYPLGSLAAHLIGHMGAVTAEDLAAGNERGLRPYHPQDRIGRLGVEWREDRLLRGERGEVIESLDHSGNVIAHRAEEKVKPGRDLVLTIDVRLQRAVESLLDSVLQRRGLRKAAVSQPPGGGGGAVVVIDVHSGAILAAASAPRFDPNHFSQNNGSIENLLSDPAMPFFDRVAQMAIPPGSVFKVLTATSLLESGIDPHEAFRCQGYLHDVDHWRCQLFRNQGIGHGKLNLVDALTQSCNVYFFEKISQIRPEALTHWAYQFGFGMSTGCDWANDSAGRLPTPASIRRDERRRWSDDDSRGLAIGQGTLTTTPLQIVRMMAAVANGGKLVRPHVVERSADVQDKNKVSAIAGLHDSTLKILRAGLGRVVSDANGTARRTVWLESVKIAGKTGTAQTGGGREDHSWFAGYAPADAPRVAFVVALEHAGSGAEAAGPVARRIVQRMHQLGYFDNTVSITTGK